MECDRNAPPAGAPGGAGAVLLHLQHDHTVSLVGAADSQPSRWETPRGREDMWLLSPEQLVLRLLSEERCLCPHRESGSPSTSSRQILFSFHFLPM